MSEAKRLKEATRENFDGFERSEYHEESYDNPLSDMQDLMRRYGARSDRKLDQVSDD